MTGTIIRDFAYQPDDPRFSGIHSVVDKKSSVIKPVDKSGTSGSEDGSNRDWEWEWSFQKNNLASPTGLLPHLISASKIT